MKTFAKIAAATLIVAATIVSATAGAEDAVKSQTVKYGDLNLTSSKGIATLYLRIESAAHNVCPGDDSDRQLHPIPGRESCFDASVARAVRQLNNSSLSAYYSAKTGHVMASLAANTVR